MSAIGRPVPRSDGMLKATGRARYTVDVELPGMLHAAVVRSPIAAGVIRGLDVAAALAVPGVHAVVTAADQPSHRHGLVIRDQQIFATDQVRYEGEPIAAVAAEDVHIARYAASLCRVEIEPLPPVVDLDSSVARGSRLAHPEWEGYEFSIPVPVGPNVAGETRSDPAGIDEAFERAVHVVEGEYRVGRQYQAYLEVKSVIAEIEDDRYVVHVSHQFPFSVRDRLASALGVRSSDVRVVGHHIGGGFGAKLDLGIEPIAVLLAKAAGRPVKLVQERTEDMITCPSRENAVLRIRTGVSEDGVLLAREFDLLLDAGAYATDTPFLCSIALLQANGAYRVGATRVRARGVYTNTAPTGAFRGVSGAHVTFAVEAHMDQIAATTGIDRRELRMRNLVGDGDRLPNGQVLDDASILTTAFNALDEHADRRPRGSAGRAGSTSEEQPLRGSGEAALVWPTNPLAGEATLRLGEDGTLRLSTAATDNGSGAVTMGLRQIAAAVLDLDPNDVITTLPDTDLQGWDGGSQGSRTTFIVGRAVVDAGEILKEKVLEVASAHLEIAPEDLKITRGVVVPRGVPDRRMTLAEIASVAASRTGSIAASASYVAPPVPYEPSCATGLLYPTFPNVTYHVHRAEVEVDPVTGNVDVVGYWVAQEVGATINPVGVRGQIQGGVTQGLGYALTETIDIGDDGRYRQRTFEAYHLPIAPDVPAIDFVLLEHPNSDGPHGAKGVGEPPVVPVAAAVANAVSDAIGVPITRLPIRPSDVLDALDRSNRVRSAG